CLKNGFSVTKSQAPGHGPCCRQLRIGFGIQSLSAAASEALKTPNGNCVIPRTFIWQPTKAHLRVNDYTLVDPARERDGSSGEIMRACEGFATDSCDSFRRFSAQRNSTDAETRAMRGPCEERSSQMIDRPIAGIPR